MTPRNYHKANDNFNVTKSINNKEISFGYYKTEEEAQKVVEILRILNWNKRLWIGAKALMQIEEQHYTPYEEELIKEAVMKK